MKAEWANIELTFKDFRPEFKTGTHTVGGFDDAA